MRDRPATKDHFLVAVVLFDIVKYTSYERPPVHFLWTLGQSLFAGFTAQNTRQIDVSWDESDEGVGG